MNGILCLDKPQQMTSFACCGALRRLFGEKRVGHAGTLDPMATGVLPVFFGRATRLIPHLPDHDKTYVSRMRFGFVSDTLDIWGNVAATEAPIPSEQALREVLPRFCGNILQVPPMVSARKYQGKRLYQLAREGVQVEREAKPTTVYELTLLRFDAVSGEADFVCRCSQGTYIRTICDDIGQLLGCGAVMTALRRTRAAGVQGEQCVALDTLEAISAAERERVLLPADALLQELPAVTVSPAQAVRFGNGGELDLARLSVAVQGKARVYAPDGRFIGLGQADADQLRVLLVL